MRANTPNPWAMTDVDIAIYDAAFIKQDKDKDGFISPDGESRDDRRKCRTTNAGLGLAYVLGLKWCADSQEHARGAVAVLLPLS